MELRTRDVDDILLLTVAGRTGFMDATVTSSRRFLCGGGLVLIPYKDARGKKVGFLTVLVPLFKKEKVCPSHF